MTVQKAQADEVGKVLIDHRPAPILVPDMAGQVDMIRDAAVVEHQQLPVCLVLFDGAQTRLDQWRRLLHALRPVLPDRTEPAGRGAGRRPLAVVDRDVAFTTMLSAGPAHVELCGGATQPPRQGRGRGRPAQRGKMRRYQRIRHRFVQREIISWSATFVAWQSVDSDFVQNYSAHHRHREQPRASPACWRTRRAGLPKQTGSATLASDCASGSATRSSIAGLAAARSSWSSCTADSDHPRGEEQIPRALHPEPLREQNPGLRAGGRLAARRGAGRKAAAGAAAMSVIPEFDRLRCERGDPINRTGRSPATRRAR